MTTTERIAPAKVNLCLHVTGRRDDGYHLLESLVVFVDLGDRLRIAPGGDLTLNVDGPFAAGVPTDGRNLVMQAAQRLRDLRGVRAGATIQLTKNLPHGGGIGGGSSDAACALHMLSRLWQVPVLSGAEALPLGADIPVCLQAPAPQFMRGIGDVLADTPPLPAMWLVLVNPGVSVPTGQVFGALGRSNVDTITGINAMSSRMTQDDLGAWLADHRNDLTPVVTGPAIAPVVGEVIAALHNHAEGAGMSGSGSTCWGWFRDGASAAICADAIETAHPDWWVRAAPVLGTSGAAQAGPRCSCDPPKM